MRDASLTFAWETSVSISASSVQELDVLDMTGGLAKDAWGSALAPKHAGGKTLWLNVVIESALTGSGTLDILLVTDGALGASSVLSTAVTVVEYDLAKTKSTATGYILQAPIPLKAIAAFERYVSVQLKANTATITGGKISAWLSLEAHNPG